jgi:aminopeptidase N
MKHTVLLLLATVLAASAAAAQQTNIYDRPVQVERSREYDAKHYQIELEVDLDAKTFAGKNTITLSPLNSGFQTCRLDQEGLVITEVLEERNIPLRFEQTKQEVIIHFPAPYSAGQEVVFTVFYHGHNPSAGLLFDDESPHHPQMASTSSFPDHARGWFPCYDWPNDKVTQEVIVTVKEHLKALSNGRLVSRTEHPKTGTVTYHWSQEEPHATYLSMLAIAPFTVIHDSLGSLPINYWVYPKEAADAAWIFAVTPGIIDFFNKLYGYDFPWAKYDQVVGPRQGGGAEATSATILGEGVYHNRQAEQDFSWERIIAHEAAHQWWGDLITLRTWSETWLNESFGTYSDYLYTRSTKGEDEGALDLQRKRGQYLNEAKNRYMRPIVFNRYNRAGDNFDSHTYPKGAAVLHMLRFILGDDAFFRTLSAFLHKHAFEPVDTHDFMKVVKEVTGQNLDWFFEQFLYQPGHPVFEVSDTWDESTHTLRLNVVQTQDTTLGVPIYRIPVVIGLTTARQKKSEKIWLTKNTEEFAFVLEEKPLLVRFDEGNYLLMELAYKKPVDELLFQVAKDDMLGRLGAARELAAFKPDERVVPALVQCATNDAFWAVRQAAWETLDKLGWTPDRELLKGACKDETSQVRLTVVQLLGNTKDPALLSFHRDQFARDSSYLVQAEALKAIGKTGVQSELSFLQTAAQMPSHHNLVKSAAEAAIKEIEKANAGK